VLAEALCRRTGATLGYLGEGANSAGACLAGVLPHRELGGRPVAQPGLDAGAMLSGGLETVVLMGLEPEFDSAAGEAALSGLERVGFVACLTPYVTVTMQRYAHVLLPIGTAYETSGTFVNCEGRRQAFSGATRPVGEARPAWKVLRVLANLLGLPGFEYLSTEEIRAELDARLAAIDAAPAAAQARDVALEHPGEWAEPCMYGTDMLLRRSPPLQDTRAGRAGGRRWA
jgi:NADH-quinone oxidoreductase subunit G